jgi:hypothetical protein
MKVFICWSERRGRAFAKVLDTWLEGLKPKWLDCALSEEIEKGAVWFTELDRALAGSGAGLIVLTPEGARSPWIHYEAGALRKSLSDAFPSEATAPARGARRIFPVLFGLDPAQLTGPLSAYQSTASHSLPDMWRLVEAIAHLMPPDEQPETAALKKAFTDGWEDLNRQLAMVPPLSVLEVAPDLEHLFRRKTFEESIHDCLNQDWVARFAGARETHGKLLALRDAVRSRCRPYAADLFDELIAELDAYAMNLSLLIGQPRADIDQDGHVSFEKPGIAAACERRRARARSLLARLADPAQAPVFDEAFRFELAQTTAERKKLIHRKAAGLREARKTRMDARPGETRSGGEDVAPVRLRDSDWDFDRILYYEQRRDAFDQQREAPAATDLLRWAQLEFEKVRWKAGRPSLMALYYALDLLARAVDKADPPGRAPLREQAESLIKDVSSFVKQFEPDRHEPIQQAVQSISRALSKT